MKAIRIFLLILIIIGIGLIVTQSVWVPKVVAMILSQQGIVSPVVLPSGTSTNPTQITKVTHPVAPTNPTATSTAFNITFKDYEGELDTYNDTYTDTFAQPPITVQLALSSTALQSLQQEIEALDLFDEQVTPQPPSEMTNPCFSYSLQVQNGSLQKELSWDCHDTSAKREAFTTFIENMITSTAAYKSLPTHGIPE
jgi:hypothetical protein